jgi:hypothetical protein
MALASAIVTERQRGSTMYRSWTDTFRDAGVSGAIACTATAAAAAFRGARDSGSAVAALNAPSHVAWSGEAAAARAFDVRHSLLGLLINYGASVFWAVIYERAFGTAAARGDAVTALAGGGAVAALAYVTDYQLMPKRLTPGWEERVSGRSLALIFAAMALSLPLRGLLARGRVDAAASVPQLPRRASRT